MTWTRPSRTFHRNSLPGLLAAALSLAAACSTQEIESQVDFLELTDSAGEGRTAPFILAVAADAETIGELSSYHASGSEYALYIDGRPVARRGDGSTWIPIDHIRAQRGPGGFLPAGAHTVQLVDQNGNTVLATPPLDVQPDRANIFVVFGRRTALEHRFLPMDLAVAPGTYRLAVLNLIRTTGYAVEIAGCDGNVPETCAPVGPPVVYGATAHADFPEQTTVPCNESVGPGITCGVGPWVGFHVVPPGGATSTPGAPPPWIDPGTGFAGILDHPNAARVRLGAPLIPDTGSGISVGL